MIALNYRDSRPIYEQIKEGFRRLILSGALATGEKLPSVRELAAELAINPNTIQRAYRELEAEGFIYSIAGKGSFAAALSEVDDSRRQELLQRFEETAKELLRLSVPADRLTARIQTLAQEAKV
jgi:GntR family transcriptional regulator